MLAAALLDLLFDLDGLEEPPVTLALPGRGERLVDFLLRFFVPSFFESGLMGGSVDRPAFGDVKGHRGILPGA